MDEPTPESSRPSRGRRPRGRGERRPGGGQDAILNAARDQFAQHGYGKASVRGIAAEAGVDPALVIHHFGSKEALFREATILTLHQASGVISAIGSADPGRADRVVRAYVDLWEDPEIGVRVRGLLQSISSNADAAQQLATMMQSEVLAITGSVPTPSFSVAMSQLLGACIARYILKVAPLRDLSPEEFVALLTPPARLLLSDPVD